MIVDIAKTFPGRLTVEAAFRLPLDPPSVLILFGPSGSGKTTVLRCLAGLEWPERGTIRFGEATWLDCATGENLPAQRRGIGYMSQDYALFPTYSVAGNIAFGLSDVPPRERSRRVAEVIALLHLQGLEQVKPQQLSGGQQQRVALARALARHPHLLLLDEPLSALDVPTRGKVRAELGKLLRDLRIPSIVVTHDWEDALALGDRMVVVHEGRVVQEGTPQDVFNRPRDADVAKIVGMESVIPGRIVAASNGLLMVEAAGLRLQAVGEGEAGENVFACIRAEDIVLEPAGGGATSARNRLAGVVREVLPRGALVQVIVDCGPVLSAIVTRSAVEDLHLMPGAAVAAVVKAGAVHLIPRREERHA